MLLFFVVKLTFWFVFVCFLICYVCMGMNNNVAFIQESHNSVHLKV